jgi:Protein of unknown function (DUF4232)
MTHRLCAMVLASVAVAVLMSTPLAGAARASRCAVAQLTITVGHSFAADQVAGANVRFMNRSSRACWLHGWPTFIFARPHGKPVKAKDAPDDVFADVKHIGDPVVLLQPRQRADAVFEGADGPLSGRGTCGPSFRTISVTPPGDSQHATVFAWIAWMRAYMPPCSQIRVSPILPSTAVYMG